MIRYRAKIVEVGTVGHETVRRVVPVPELTRGHCDMHAFRTHPRYGALANSDLFAGILRGIRDHVGGQYHHEIDVDAPPPGVTVDTSGFLAVVRIYPDALRVEGGAP